jgi:hypothetical protein
MGERDNHDGYGQCTGTGSVWVDDGAQSNFYRQGSCPKCRPASVTQDKDELREAVAREVDAEAFGSTLPNRYKARQREARAKADRILALLSPSTGWREWVARSVWCAFEEALSEGSPTISLQGGKLWIDDAAFDCERLVSALSVAPVVGGERSSRDSQTTCAAQGTDSLGRPEAELLEALKAIIASEDGFYRVAMPSALREAAHAAIAQAEGK